MDQGEIPRSNPAYAEVARLSELIARRHGNARWNGTLIEIPGRHPGVGSLTREGHLKLSSGALAQLRDPTRHDDHARAVAAVIHEQLHASQPPPRPTGNPNAVLDARSRELDEGLTEFLTREEFAEIAAEAGHPHLTYEAEVYRGAVSATQAALQASTGQEDVRDIAANVYAAEVVDRFYSIAAVAVRTQLGDLLPESPEHQQAARAHIASEIASAPVWNEFLRDSTDPSLGPDVRRRIENAISAVRDHAATSAEPFPSPAQSTPQPRTQPGQDQQRYPPPDPSTRVSLPAGAELPVGATEGSLAAKVLSDQAAANAIGASAATSTAARSFNRWVRGPGTARGQE